MMLGLNEISVKDEKYASVVSDRAVSIYVLPGIQTNDWGKAVQLEC